MSVTSFFDSIYGWREVTISDISANAGVNTIAAAKADHRVIVRRIHGSLIGGAASTLSLNDGVTTWGPFLSGPALNCDVPGLNIIGGVGKIMQLISTQSTSGAITIQYAYIRSQSGREANSGNV